jgi:hypothetical protein
MRTDVASDVSAAAKSTCAARVATVLSLGVLLLPATVRAASATDPAAATATVVSGSWSTPGNARANDLMCAGRSTARST